MKKIIYLLLLMTIFSCSTSQTNDEVPYKEAQRYFVKNTVSKIDGAILINSQDQFEKYFGAAAVMGKDGMPTKIDFSKEFVIGVIADEVDNSVDFKVNSLVKNGDILFLKMNKQIGEKLSFTIRPSIILIVDNKYKTESISTQID